MAWKTGMFPSGSMMINRRITAEMKSTNDPAVMLTDSLFYHATSW
jgi:hypothetical protein